MTETYTALGSDSNWIDSLLPVPALIALSFKRRRAGVHPMVAWWQVPIALYFLVSSIVGLPFEWILGGACLGGAVVGVANAPRPGVAHYRLLRLLRWVTMPIFVCLGAYFTLMIPLMFPHRIILSDRTATTLWVGRTDVATRAGMRVYSIKGGNSGWNLRPWKSWTSFSGQDLGPSMAGFDIFWGPHGFIRGDALGEHIANWAGVKPNEK